MMNEKRILSGGVLALSVLSGVAPIFFVFALLFTIRFKRYWEVLVAGFCFELIYGSGAWLGFLPAPVFTASLLIFLGVVFFRAKLRTA